MKASRRGFLAAAGLAAAAPGPASAAAATASASEVAFHGAHQAGIATPQQKHLCFATFDLVAKDRAGVVALLRAWTDAAARLAAGQTAAPLPRERVQVAPDGGAALGLDAARLTLTIGFGPGLFLRDGKDRYGLAPLRPAALVDLPKFNGDQLDPAMTGGDLCVQACADDPQVAFHAIRELDRLAYGTAQLRWQQTGFLPGTAPGDTPRNLMGFKDGTNNPPIPGCPHGRVGSRDIPRGFDAVVWAGTEAPAWMQGGSYMVARRIRIALEHWDRSEMDFQEETIGRQKYSGAPLGGTGEFDLLDLDAQDSEGNPVIPELAHVRLAAPAANDGAQMFRRAYSYNDGARFTAERWPPWRQGMMFDAGLFFIAFQNDPRSSFIKVFETMAKLDAMNQFTTHVGGGLFACPAGVAPGHYIGQALFEA